MGYYYINRVRLDSLAKWPSAKTEKNMSWIIFFLQGRKHTKPDITHVVKGGLLEGQAGRSSSLGIFAGLS